MAEISAERRQRLLEQHADINVDHDWWDSTVEDFVTVLAAFGLDVRTRPIRKRDPTAPQTPCVYFQLNYAQGDGSTFETEGCSLYDIWERGRATLDKCAAGEGDYNSDPATWTGYLKSCHVLWSAINDIAPTLLALNSDVVQEILGGATVGVGSGRYSNAICVEWDYGDCDRGDNFDPDNPVHIAVYNAVKALCETNELRDLIDDINGELYRALESEHDHLTSEEAVWGSIVANSLDTPEEDDEYDEYDEDELDEAA